MGGAAVGFGVFLVVARLRKLITDPVLDTAISFVVPFGTYILAEKINASGVIAVVVTGLLLGHKAPIVQTAQSRIAERMNWRTIAFVLENTVFLLIGLQAHWIVHDVSESDLSSRLIVGVCAAVLVGCIVLRIAWVFPARYLLIRPGPDPTTGQRPPWTFTLILGWAGIRGVVTLAAAFVIPEDTPNREVLLLIAFTVVAGTLFIQGLSLPMLARRLHVPAPDPMEDALARATLLQQASKAGYLVLKKMEYDDQQGVTELIKQRIEQRNFAAWERLGTQADVESPSELYARIRLEMIDAERKRVLEVRDQGQVASDIVSEVLAMLDVEESMIDVAQASRDELKTEYSRVRRTGASCAHLEDHPVQPVEQEPSPVCQACLDGGTTWVSLRLCLDCGNIGCCDSSVMRHATGHFREYHAPRHAVRRAPGGLALVLRAPRHGLSRDVVAVRPAGGRRPVARWVPSAQRAPQTPGVREVRRVREVRAALAAQRVPVAPAGRPASGARAGRAGAAAEEVLRQGRDPAEAAGPEGPEAQAGEAAVGAAARSPAGTAAACPPARSPRCRRPVADGRPRRSAGWSR